MAAGVNHRFDEEAWRAPGNHFEGNRRIRHELLRRSDEYGDLYTVSIRARYRELLRRSDDDRHQAADGLPRRMWEKPPF